MSPRVYPAVVVAVHDGDTVEVTASLGFDVWRNVSVRLSGINAIELAQPGGKDARDHLIGLMPVGSVVTLTSLSYDKYGGRVDGTLGLSGGRDASAVMVADGFAAAWNGKGPRPVPPWPIPVVS